MFGMNDNTSKFALLEAKRAKRKALEIENISLAQILTEIDNINNTLLTLASVQEQDVISFENINTKISTNIESINTINNKILAIENDVSSFKTTINQKISDIELSIQSITSSISSLDLRVIVPESKGI